MKKIFVFLAVMGAMAFSAQQVAAQDATETKEVTEVTDLFAGTGEDIPLHQALKTKFIEGGPGFMAAIVACLILGLAIAIERILTLTLSTTNVKKLLAQVEDALKQENGIEKAKAVCADTRGPVASIFRQGLEHFDGGVEAVEKNVVASGAVESSEMETGLAWLSLFIATATNLGFLGTVIGMVKAFDAIQAAGDISPNVVAGGMKVALITTIGGLIVALILQMFYNYILTKIESLTVDMERSTIEFVDLVAKYNK